MNDMTLETTTRPRLAPAARLLFAALLLAPAACGDSGTTSASESVSDASTADASSAGSTAPSSTGSTNASVTASSGQTGGETGSSSGETSGKTTDPSTTGDETTGDSGKTTVDPGTTTGDTGKTTDDSTSDTGKTTSDTGKTTGDSGGLCSSEGESCADGELCCAQLNCCAGVPVPPGQEFCSSMCPISDRDRKREFAPVDVNAVLERVASLPITTWSYKHEDRSIRHIGPMAQDFKAAFEVGASDRMIFQIDADGVSLAAVQALHQRVQTLDAENESLRDTVAALERRLDALEARP